MSDIREKWSIKKSAASCFSSGYNFKDNDVVISQIILQDGEYIRRDFCENNKPENVNEISVWKTLYTSPILKEELIKKEGVEGLFRNFIQLDAENNEKIIFILAVMLERKKVLKEQEINESDNGGKIRIYAHRETNEIFLIKDPNLQLNDLELLKDEIAVLLGGKSRIDLDSEKIKQ